MKLNLLKRKQYLTTAEQDERRALALYGLGMTLLLSIACWCEYIAEDNSRAMWNAIIFTAMAGCFAWYLIRN